MTATIQTLESKNLMKGSRILETEFFSDTFVQENGCHTSYYSNEHHSAETDGLQFPEPHLSKIVCALSIENKQRLQDNVRSLYQEYLKIRPVLGIRLMHRNQFVGVLQQIIMSKGLIVEKSLLKKCLGK